ncbi:MAG: LysR family transcriptional regulator [Pseudomonadota bacterium]
MRFNKLDLNQLVVLDALLFERNVTKASERLFLSQSATSCALARLRDYFDDDLLMSIGKTLVLTPLAESMIAPLRDVLLQVQAITQSKQHFDPLLSSRKITIEASDYVMSVFLIKVIQCAAIEAPHMQFDLRSMGVNSLEHLDRGDTDLLIAPAFYLSSSHPADALFEDSFSCVAWSGNDSIGDELTLDTYLHSGHVCTEWGAGRYLALDHHLTEQIGMQLRREILAPSFTVLPAMVIGNKRLATIQTRLAKQMAQTAPLRVLKCPLAIPNLVETLQWHKHQQRDPAISWVRNLLKRTAAQLADAD